MSEAPDRELINAIAVELGVDPSFVEKDWHAVRLLAAIGAIPDEGIRPVFSGGTSLSKGHDLIRRFSEDLDFKLAFDEAAVGRPARRRYREKIVQSIRRHPEWAVDDDEIISRNDSRFFSCQIGYASEYKPAAALRPRLRLEMTFRPPALRHEERAISSFVATARGESPEVEAMPCVAPAETAADKLSALTWRVLTRNRDAPDDDPTIIRHLYDLVPLETIALYDRRFPGLLRKTVLRDTDRVSAAPGIAELEPTERLARALALIATDPEYRDEYESFVVSMSYAREGETTTFEDAIAAAERVAAVLP